MKIKTADIIFRMCRMVVVGQPKVITHDVYQIYRKTMNAI